MERGEVDKRRPTGLKETELPFHFTANS